MNKKNIRDLIGMTVIFIIFKLFSLGSNYEGMVIVILGLIYWKIDDVYELLTYNAEEANR